MQVRLKYRLFEKLELRRQLRRSKYFAASFIFIMLIVVGALVVILTKINPSPAKSKFGALLKSPTPTATPTPSPTPRPLTFAEMNALYGPCARLPVLMYHHIQSEEAARESNQTSLTVYTDYFKSQMEYLKNQGYNVVSMNDLVNFFDSGTPIPKGGILITFDDGYQDFYTDAYPILLELGFHATMFVPTGLVQNPGYLNWEEILSMNGLIFFANHTWSHKNVQVSGPTMEYEISTADTQLSDHGLNSPKVFAYPYGLDTGMSEKFLNSLDYKAAFTTVPGSTLCKKLRFELPRIRIGNTPLSAYGF